MSSAEITYTDEETAAHRKLWVEALRSGEYSQTRERLNVRGEGFCCLGVACDLYAKATGDGEWKHENRIGRFAHKDDSLSGSTTSLTFEVKSWLGLSNSHGRFVNADKGVEYLTQLNDDGHDFKQISDIIEAEPSGLVKKRNEAAAPADPIPMLQPGWLQPE